MRLRQAVFQFSVALAMVAAISSSIAQSPFVDSPNRSIVKGAAVEYLFPEQVTIPSGKPSPVVLHFRIAQGLHINSHTPHDDYLIPTNFAIPAESGVRLDIANYPQGSDITLPLDPKTKLSVYTGEFAIQASIIAPPGNHLVQASLRFQACDKSACMPPKTITVPIDVIGQ
ncbi:MAG TPA: protein-disulfide reductase DsbD domain-containing protein [Terracidiphilus sp.]|jgi:hypothetical protein|nr:protein-disulfide reductase DsbD domain-containing protein [Terracidiphilus sp.]